MARLKEIGRIITGNTPKTSEIENYNSNDICFIKPSDLLENDVTYINDSEFYISETARDKARILPPQSILVTCIGIIGKVAINQKECAFNQQINAIIPDFKKCLPNYLAYAIQHKKNDMLDIANTAVVPILNKTQFSSIEINLPPLDEQCKIASVLDKLTGLISFRKQQLAKLDELVKARFVEMFGDPAANPMKWKTPPLSSCLKSIENGRSFVCESEPRRDNWPAVLKLSAVTYGEYRAGENKSVLDVKDFVQSAEIHDDDLLFTRKNTPELVGMSAYIFETQPYLMMPDLIFRLNTNEKCDKIFLWQLINHDLFRTSISNLASGSAKSMSNISKERLANLQIICPPVELQNSFAEFVRRTYRQKLTIQQSLDKLEVLKKSLMQEYFGG